MFGRIVRKIKTIIWKIFNPEFHNLILYEVPRIYFKNRIRFGTNVHINDGVFIHAVGGVKIGDDCTLSHGCSIISTGLYTNEWRTRAKKHICGEVTIGNNVWLCANSTVLEGVYIADDTIIAAGAVVNKSIFESGYIWGGVPAKRIKRIE